MFEDFCALWTVVPTFLERCTVSIVSVEVNKRAKAFWLYRVFAKITMGFIDLF